MLNFGCLIRADFIIVAEANTQPNDRGLERGWFACMRDRVQPYQKGVVTLCSLEHVNRDCRGATMTELEPIHRCCRTAHKLRGDIGSPPMPVAIVARGD